MIITYVCNVMSLCKDSWKQESIPVGCVPTAEVASTSGGVGVVRVYPLDTPQPDMGHSTRDTLPYPSRKGPGTSDTLPLRTDKHPWKLSRDEDERHGV